MTATLLDSYMPFDTGPGSSVNEDGWRQFAKYFSGDGIKRGIANGFNTFGDSTGMQVKVDTGECQIQGQWGKGTSIKTQAIASNASGSNRLDLVILRNDFVANSISVDVLTGSSPTVLPTLTQNTTKWEVQLAVVTVPNGAVTITAGNVQFIPQVADVIVGGQFRTADTGAVATTEAVVVTTGKFALAPNSVYRVWFKVFGGTNSGPNSVGTTIRIRANNASGQQVDIVQPFTDSLGHFNAMLSGYYVTTTTENTAFVGTVNVTSGTTIHAAGANSTAIGVEFYGPSSNVGSVP